MGSMPRIIARAISRENAFFLVFFANMILPPSFVARSNHMAAGLAWRQAAIASKALRPVLSGGLLFNIRSCFCAECMDMFRRSIDIPGVKGGGGRLNLAEDALLKRRCACLYCMKLVYPCMVTSRSHFGKNFLQDLRYIFDFVTDERKKQAGSSEPACKGFTFHRSCGKRCCRSG